MFLYRIVRVLGCLSDFLKMEFLKWANVIEKQYAHGICRYLGLKQERACHKLKTCACAYLPMSRAEFVASDEFVKFVHVTGVFVVVECNEIRGDRRFEFCIKGTHIAFVVSRAFVATNPLWVKQSPVLTVKKSITYPFELVPEPCRESYYSPAKP